MKNVLVLIEKKLVNNKIVDEEELFVSAHLMQTNSELEDKAYRDIVYCSAPTLQMVMKWLREEHNLAIATYTTVYGWHSGVSRIKFNGEGFIVNVIDNIDGGNIPNCDTWEEACEAAIKYCLENLI